MAPSDRNQQELPANPEDWRTYRLLVIETLRRLEDRQEQLTRDMNTLISRLALVETMLTRISAMESKLSQLQSDHTSLRTSFATLGAGISIVVSGLVALLVKWLAP